MHITVKVLLFAFLFSSVFGFQVTAEPLASYLPAEILVKLQAGEDVRATATGKSASLSLAPRHPAVSELVRALADEAPDVIVEAVFLWKKPRPAAMQAELLAVYNVLRSIGSLQGIEYFSASRGRMRLFYEYSSLIVASDDPSPVSDTLLPGLPINPETLYARQKDLSFGDNRYRVALSSGKDFVYQTSTNLTTMRYAFVPVANPGELSVRLFVISADDTLVFYAVSSARATVVPGVRSKLEASFGNRAEAVFSWFDRQLALRWPGTN